MTAEDFFNGGVLPYETFTSSQWAKFSEPSASALSAEEIEAVRSIGDPINIEEVERIYLSLIGLLAINIENATQLANKQKAFFKGGVKNKQPFIIGIAGSVAVGKSTMARILQILLHQLKHKPKVDLITTDGFLYPNASLLQRDKMQRKGFPDSYDIGALLNFLAKVKARHRNVTAPLYSHVSYDILANETTLVDQPDILIVEGINVLQTYNLVSCKPATPFVSDFFNFSIYIDAKISNIEQWYLKRFMQLRATSFNKNGAYFQKYAKVSEKEAYTKALDVWKNINLKNLRENIAPTKHRADLILYKGDNHLVEKIKLRRI